MRNALSLAAPNAGNNRAARMAMMAMTTRSSISVNALEFRLGKKRHFLNLVDNQI